MESVKDLFLIFLSVMAIINCYLVFKKQEKFNELKQQNIELQQKCDYLDSIIISSSVGSKNENE